MIESIMRIGIVNSKDRSLHLYVFLPEIIFRMGWMMIVSMKYKDIRREDTNIMSNMMNNKNVTSLMIYCNSQTTATK